jgi:hypothetical protein
MTRKGKIARLPHPLREQVNLRMQNGETASRLAEWLNGLPEVTALLASEFDGQPINEINLSNWKLGGYRDWEAQQEALEAVRRCGGDAAELSHASAGQLADQIAVCLTARIAIALQKSETEILDPAGQLQRLRLLCADLVALRKGDHNAQWLKIEREKLDLELKKYDDLAADRRKEAEEANRDPRERCVTKETLDRIAAELKLL